MGADVSQMFSSSGDAHHWDAMYDGPVDNFDKYIFRERRDFAVETIRSHVKLQSKILDLGCGAGPFTSELLNYDYDIYATDYSADILQKARIRIDSQGKSEVPLLQSDSQKLPYRSKAFDAIVCLGVISYVPNRSAMVEELHRTLKDDGLMVITFRNFYNPIIFDPVNLVKFAFGRISTSIRHEEGNEFVPGAFLKPKEVKELLISSGFVIEGVKGIGSGPFKIRRRVVFPLSVSIYIDKLLGRISAFLGGKGRLNGADVVVFICRKAA